MLRLGPFLALLPLALAVTSCASHTPADPARGTGPAPVVAAESWPARRTVDLQAIAAAMPRRLDQISTREVPGQAEPQMFRIPTMAVDAALPCGNGIVRALTMITSDGAVAHPERFPELQFLSYRPGEETVTELAGDGTINMLYYIFSGDHFEVKLPEGKRVGLLLHFASLTGDDYSEAAVEEFRRRGWVVLLAPHKLISSGFSTRVSTLDDVPRAARALAEQADQGLAEQAYATEAVLDFLAREHPDIPQRPLVLAGFSAGSLAVPTVAARLGDRVDALVVAAGGANLHEITRDSSMRVGSLKVEWDDGVESAALREQLSREYLQASRLDPYHTSLTTHATPTLALLGRFDAIAPAANGRLLWRRLGRPDCLRFFGGHAILFWRLPAWKEWIADWVEERVASGQ